jgi:hypothetical protein
MRMPHTDNRVYDLGDPEAISYQDLMAATAKALGLTRRFIPIGLLSPALSRLWVSMTTGAPRALVAPLIESLKHEMIPRRAPKWRLEGLRHIPLDEMLSDAAREASTVQDEPLAFRSPKPSGQKDTVRSVQRMTLPVGRDARWAAEEYVRWLPAALPGVLSVSQEPEAAITQFHLSSARLGPVLLRLRHRKTRSETTRQVFRVMGGLLASETERGRLEFRQVLDGRTLLAAIHDFVPRLPWWIYRLSQAEVHRIIMRRFAAHLARQPPASSGGT